jgi:cold shock CspA family protein
MMVRIRRFPSQPEAVANDQMLTDRILSQAFRDRAIPHGRVNVNVQNGIAVLRGELDRPEQIREVEEAVEQIPGVRKVESYLHLPEVGAANKRPVAAAPGAWPRPRKKRREILKETSMHGTVDRVVPEGGFGFLIGPNGEEYFFHRTGLKGTDFEDLGPGVTVEFQAGESEGDEPDEHLRAVNVRLAEDAVPAVDNEPLPPEKIGGK